MTSVADSNLIVFNPDRNVKLPHFKTRVVESRRMPHLELVTLNFFLVLPWSESEHQHTPVLTPNRETAPDGES